MKFGVFNVMQQRDRSQSAEQVLLEAVDQAVSAEALGFDSCWFPEHHASNYSLCPSPLMMVNHCAARTNRIRLGTGVIVAPLYKPIRLLGEIGLADVLSSGRLELGVGAGYQPFEFERFGADLSINKEATLELLDLIELGLTKTRFEYNGKHFQQPSASMPVQPLQKPLPPIWLVGSDPSFHQRAAERGYAVFVSGLLGRTESIIKLRHRVEQQFAVVGKSPDQLRMGLLRYAFVARNKADARRYAECALYQTRLAYALRTKTESISGDYVVDERPFKGEPTIDELLDRLIIGDVDTCIERAVREIRDARVNDLVIQAKLGDLPHTLALDSLALWMEEVVPGIERELGMPIADVNPVGIPA
ncbi:MAG: LLM class flavin-dependent oxidoreductase [Pseudomonadales bacterium]|nr:LLM class flavin-dependent oxidoreductase [Pseudomonadales bacterium]